MEAYSFKSNLHQAASLHYDALPSHEKAALLSLFQQLDTNGDGVISQAELVHAFHTSSMPKMANSLQTVFSLLDKDGNGNLDLQECKALLFILSAYAICDHCNTIILDNLSFMCQVCWNLRECQFDLCLKCYPARATLHPRDHVFAPRNQILNQAAHLLLRESRCVICGDVHIKGITGYTSNMHMVRRGDEYVCEWCSSWICNNCGKFSQDLTGASPGKWLVKTYHCWNCGRPGMRANWNPMFKGVMESNVVKACSTCNIKANNGTLFAFMSDSSTSSTSSVEIFENEQGSSNHALAHFVQGVNNASAIFTAIQVFSSCTIL